MSDPNQEEARWSGPVARRAMTVADMRAAALSLSVLGLPVFPCVPGEKRPLTRNGFHDATTSARMIDRWWRRTPDANIGIATGAASGLVVVDVDVHADGSGFGAFDDARAAGITGGWGWLVRTPSGGLHAYYRFDSGATDQRSWQVSGAHIDFRGEGGYILAPPSRLAIDGQKVPYRVIAVARHDARSVDSHALRSFLDPPPARSPTSSQVGSTASLRVAPQTTHPDKLAAWVAERPEGARNQGLFWAACRMVESGHRFDATLSVLGDAARAAGLPDREVETTIRSAYRTAAHVSLRTPMREGVEL